ncbi:MAG: hypothetical protein H5T66_06695, partial [Chloroflexi bacterium]|nr:hypothetical protein [Chloroflexota bacterium]
FALILVTQFDPHAIHYGDTRWYIPTAFSLIHEGDTDLDEYRDMVTQREAYATRSYNGHLYNRYPIGPTLMALPFVYVFDRLAFYVFGLDLYAQSQKEYLGRIESAVAVNIAALAAVVVYFLCRLSLDRGRALIPTLLFAYAMNTWPIAGQSLWQHGPSMLVLALALYFLLRAEQDDRWVYAAALPLFFSYVIRPTNALPVLLFSLYVFMRHQRRFPLFIGLGLVTILPVFIDGYIKSGRLLDPYYSFAGGSGTVRTHPRWDGLPGTLISPGRGLFIYSPVLLFSLVGLWLKIRRKQLHKIDAILLAVIVIHWVSISIFSAGWWGGHSIGPRFFTDLNPFFAFYLIPLFERPLGVKWPYRVGAYASLGILALISGWIQWRCATNRGVLLWSGYPVNVDTMPSRLWDWHDVPFLRGIQFINPNIDIAPAPRASLLFAPYKTNARFGEMIALRGYEVRADPLLEGVNGKVIVRLYWQALRPPDFDYSVFVHVLDAEGNLVTQSDHAPGAVAGYPPTYWRRGQVVVDEHIVPIPAQLASGSYAIEVGVYNWATGERLLLEGGQGDRVRLRPHIEVLPPLPFAIYIPFIAVNVPR